MSGKRKPFRSTAETKRIIAKSDYLRSLLAEFGVRLAGFDPGITGYLERSGQGDGYFGEHISLSGMEWSWIEPLLVELQAKRRAEVGR